MKWNLFFEFDIKMSRFLVHIWNRGAIDLALNRNCTKMADMRVRTGAIAGLKRSLDAELGTCLFGPVFWKDGSRRRIGCIPFQPRAYLPDATAERMPSAGFADRISSLTHPVSKCRKLNCVHSGERLHSISLKIELNSW
jgi:hypothetical protein